MSRIRIVNIPEGPGIPEEIRKEWIGVEFKAGDPIETQVQSLLTANETFGLRKVYKVSTNVALCALKLKNEKAREWFNARPLAPFMCFNIEACKLVMFRRYTLADAESNIESVIKTMASENIKDVLGLLKLNHSLWYWIEAHHMLEKINNTEDIKFVEAFWNLLEYHGIKLSDEQKIEIFRNFMED